MAILSGCSDFPDLDSAVSPEARRAEYPELVPIDGILARRGMAQLDGSEAEILAARAANLRARGQLLRDIAVNEDTRLRLTPELERLGG
ncbi:hypothetical protein [Pseudoruegeria sp. HB172150]|uniref:hypothetical protein n=1 Tax=Pseudoruegeria sp. HB172150 TaxID=2721164 RepID=UPI001553DDFE|nr:hypothetical protein [Pseudoruegeria sp. HB172150]